MTMIDVYLLSLVVTAFYFIAFNKYIENVSENRKVIITLIASLLPLLNTVIAIAATIAVTMDIGNYLKQLFIVKAHEKRMKRLFGDAFYEDNTEEDDCKGDCDDCKEYCENNSLYSDESYDENGHA